MVFEKPFKIDAVKFTFVWLARSGLIQNAGAKWATQNRITVDHEHNGAIAFPQVASPKSTSFLPVRVLLLHYCLSSFICLLFSISNWSLIHSPSL